ncbi:MAG TPA: plastocyanin/azurin family copper-binding protein [Nitrososphaeraceae archaeon]
MRSVGVLAFASLMVLGAITGIITFYLFAKVAPTPGVMDSLYRKDLPKANSSSNSGSGGLGNGTTASNVAASKISGPIGATLTVLQGASIQGNPAFSPNLISVKKGSVVEVVNKDSVPHTVTNGKGPDDPNSGKLFDTSIINAGESAKVDTSRLTSGQQYPFHCTVHPYMTGTLKAT